MRAGAEGDAVRKHRCRERAQRIEFSGVRAKDLCVPVRLPQVDDHGVAGGSGAAIRQHHRGQCAAACDGARRVQSEALVRETLHAQRIGLEQRALARMGLAPFEQVMHEVA